MQLVSKNNVSFYVKGNVDHWRSYENGSWEADTFKILDKFLKADDIMMDIGAWIGPISLYSSCKIKHCYSFEPDPVAYRELTENIKLNPSLANKITTLNMAISVDGQNVKLYSRYSHGDSGSSLLKRIKSKNDYVEVSSMTFDQFISKHNVRKIDFIKMDIEGGEFFILPQIMPFLKTSSPNLLISFHPAALLEYYELTLIPFGVLRRVYRLIDPHKSLLKRRVQRKLKELIGSLDFYKIYDNALHVFKIEDASPEQLEHLDMLVFVNSSY